MALKWGEWSIRLSLVLGYCGIMHRTLSRVINLKLLIKTKIELKGCRERVRPAWPPKGVSSHGV